MKKTGLVLLIVFWLFTSTAMAQSGTSRISLTDGIGGYRGFPITIVASTTNHTTLASGLYAIRGQTRIFRSDPASGSIKRLDFSYACLTEGSISTFTIYKTDIGNWSWDIYYSTEIGPGGSRFRIERTGQDKYTFSISQAVIHSVLYRIILQYGYPQTSLPICITIS